MKQPGFLLIELIVYIFLSLTLALITFKSVSHVIGMLRELHTDSFRVTRLYAAGRALEYELEQASCDLTQWLKIESQTIQWLHDNRRITWKFKNQKLIRSVATFDTKKNRWRKDGSATLADNIIGCSFVLDQHDNHIDTMAYTIKGQLSNKKIVQVEHILWPMKERII